MEELVPLVEVGGGEGDTLKVGGGGRSLEGGILLGGKRGIGRWRGRWRGL